VIIAWTSLFLSTRSMRAFSTLMILPRIGRIAWNCGLRPPLALPPALSPSTT
jgi:predicted small lipoprotein YifL